MIHDTLWILDNLEPRKRITKIEKSEANRNGQRIMVGGRQRSVLVVCQEPESETPGGETAYGEWQRYRDECRSKVDESR
jgi:hypothetical protein